MNLLLLQYNNYYNRRVKKESSLNNYRTAAEAYKDIGGINFNPNDGVDTEQIINWNETWNPDYLICYDTDIVSRWFVVEAVRTRAQQYQLTLHRDVVVDNYNEIINAPCFIEKATLSNSDPMIFNRESMTYNQIKTNEIALKDNTGVAWLVGYCTAKNDITDITPIVNTGAHYDFNATSLSNWEYYDYTNLHPGGAQPLYTTEISGNVSIKSWAQAGSGQHVSIIAMTASVNMSDGSTSSQQIGGAGLGLAIRGNLSLNDSKNRLANSYSTIKTNITNQLGLQYFNPSSLDGKILRADGVYYKIRVNNIGATNFNAYTTAGQALYNTLAGIVSASSDYSGTPDNQSFNYNINSTTYNISLERMTGWSATFSLLDENIITNAPYRVIAIPYPDFGQTVRIKGTEGGNHDFNRESALAIANAIIKAGDENVYDFQLLPYCPINYFSSVQERELSLSGVDTNYYTLVKSGTSGNYTYHGIVLEVMSPSFTVDLPTYYLPSNLTTITDPKVENECDLWRLVSPNYNGVFDFSAAKNDGVTQFNVDCDYKPYSPYIHINPAFKGLYGDDWDDARGLICGGDFSLTQIKDQWESYELNNKNYQLIFDRQIQNMEVNNAVQLEKDTWAATAGALTGGISGASTGAMASGGNPYAAAAGAVIGLTTSAVGGARDIALNEKLRNETLDYTKDLFGYNLGNIQALPYSLTKVSSLNRNNKTYPILEYYTCTDEEKEALRNKILYDGMTVMRIGIIADFLHEDESYIKGKLIRLTDINDDYHLLKAIAEELNKGVFIK